MAEQGGDYHRGDMDIQEQAATYSAFMGLTKWGSLATAAALIWLVLWFCTDAGFFAGLIAAVATTVAGVVFMRDKPAAH